MDVEGVGSLNDASLTKWNEQSPQEDFK